MSTIEIGPGVSFDFVPEITQHDVGEFDFSFFSTGGVKITITLDTATYHDQERRGDAYRKIADIFQRMASYEGPII